jgi:hypothetical protein
MPFTQDAYFSDTYTKLMRQTISIDVGDTTPGLFKGALWQGSITPDFSQSNPAYGTSPWDSGEPIGSPGYTTGGEDLTVISFGELVGTANKVGWKFDPVTWSAATIAAEGLLIYAPSLSGRAFIFRYFGQSYDSSNGDYELNFHTDGATRFMLRLAA